MRKMSRPVRKVNAYVAGLDVHSKKITFCILDRKGQEVASGEFDADRRSLARFEKQYVGRKRFHFALEASGYSLWVYDALRERHGEERVHVAQAKKIRAIANSRRKNDANDAFWLAYLTHEGRLPEAWIPTGELRELRLATRCRIRAVRRRTALATIIRSHLGQVGIRIATSLADAPGFTLARKATGTVPGVRGQALEQYLEEYEQQTQRIQAWEQRIEAICQDLPAVRAIQQEIPGLGRVLAAVVYAETGPIERFESAKQLGGFTGLPPADRSSGGRTRHGAISREGSAFLRWALHEAVMACEKSRSGPGRAVGDWVRKKAQRMGHKRKARCAAARKLAETLWRFFHYGECFDAARAFGG